MMTDQEIMRELKRFFFEKLKNDPRFRSLNLSAMWRDIEKNISIPQLRSKFPLEEQRHWHREAACISLPYRIKKLACQMMVRATVMEYLASFC
jgi:hypothetical protein